MVEALKCSFKETFLQNCSNYWVFYNNISKLLSLITLIWSAAKKNEFIHFWLLTIISGAGSYIRHLTSLLILQICGQKYDALNCSNNTNTLQPCLSRFDGISSDPNEQRIWINLNLSYFGLLSIILINCILVFEGTICTLTQDFINVIGSTERYIS